MEDRKSPLDLAVNNNTVSIRGQIQNPRYQGVECNMTGKNEVARL